MTGLTGERDQAFLNVDLQLTRWIVDSSGTRL